MRFPLAAHGMAFELFARFHLVVKKLSARLLEICKLYLVLQVRTNSQKLSLLDQQMDRRSDGTGSTQYILETLLKWFTVHRYVAIHFHPYSHHLFSFLWQSPCYVTQLFDDAPRLISSKGGVFMHETYKEGALPLLAPMTCGIPCNPTKVACFTYWDENRGFRRERPEIPQQHYYLVCGWPWHRINTNQIKTLESMCIVPH